MKEEKDTVKNYISVGKELVSLLRDLALLILAVLLLAFPVTFNTILTNAGFEEGSLAGFKWKNKLIQSDEALNEAQVTIKNLRERLDKTTKALAEAQTKLTDPAFKAQLSKINNDNRQVTRSSGKVLDAVQSTIKLNAPLVEQAQKEISASSDWGVVFSGDATLDEASHEAKTVAPKRFGIKDAKIFLRHGSYRTVFLAGSRSQAEQLLYKVRQFRKDAYIVNMASWCPVTDEKNGYLECSFN